MLPVTHQRHYKQIGTSSQYLMRYLIVSDIHSNRFGLEAVLQDACGAWDQLLCLGDVVGYGAHPNECCELLRQFGTHVVMGNHDAAALGSLSPEEFHEFAAVAIHWTRERLAKENWIWLNQASGAEEVRGGSGALPFFITHGNLAEPFYETYIRNSTDAYEDFERLHERGGALCFFGHTHKAFAYKLALPMHLDSEIAATALPQGGNIAIERDRLYIVNPGSCGQPRDGNPQARYALFDAMTRELQVRAVQYDVRAACAAIHKAGLPIILGDRLLEAW